MMIDTDIKYGSYLHSSSVLSMKIFVLFRALSVSFETGFKLQLNRKKCDHEVLNVWRMSNVFSGIDLEYRIIGCILLISNFYYDIW